MTDELYHKAMMRHAADASHAGRLEDADGTATVDNPMCGDRVTVDLKLDDGTIAEIAQTTRACVLCQAAAAMIADIAEGRTADDVATAAAEVKAMLREDAEAPAEPWGEFGIFEPVRPVRNRHTCVLLPFEAVEKAAADAAQKAGQETS